MSRNSNNFESLGAHLRNLLTPYANLIQLTEELLKAKRENNEEEFNKIFNMLKNYDFDNLQDIIDFSFIEQMELINWRDSKLYHMQAALEETKMQTALEEMKEKENG